MTTLVLGTGVSGVAAGRLAKRLGHDVGFYDEQPDGSIPLDLQASLVARGHWSDHLLDGVDLVVTSPGFKPSSPPLTAAAAHGVDIVTEAGFALEHLDTPYIAITGTNGKSTTTELTTNMLVASGIDAVAAGNIGTPVCDLVGSSHQVLVVELSSFQLHWMSPKPIAAALLNVAPDHLDWHGSFAAYAATKSRVFSFMDKEGVLAFNADDDVVVGLVSDAQVRAVPCSGLRLPKGGNGVQDDDLFIDAIAFSPSTQDASYRLDIVAAATVAVAAGATPDGIRRAIKSFGPADHRRRLVATIDGVAWINDSKATNPHAAMAAANAFESVLLLAGGRNKGLDLTPIGKTESLRGLYAFGESGPEIAAAATVPATVYQTMSEAIRAAARDAKAGDVVLLSPGCTSFDEFTSYADRGRVFSEIVMAMKGDETP
ncbi:MAG: UDP-N-acetylmuramoyl-L-alanine--D-glutamate ligase [Acidimicrobiia bacterium]|nr:UDP-N-acetylmuramoyl-L-alanine--D-glutamate ligase [Acidimicrobiia bacterium]